MFMSVIKSFIQNPKRSHVIGDLASRGDFLGLPDARANLPFLHQKLPPAKLQTPCNLK